LESDATFEEVLDLLESAEGENWAKEGDADQEDSVDPDRSRRRRGGFARSPWEIVGENLADSLASSGTRTGRFNVIPWKIRVPCRRVLVVCVGLNDKVEHRIYQAIEHLLPANCGGKTGFVIFWASTWDSLAWRKHAHSFKGTEAWIKIVYGGRGRLRQ
jgi:hypothetical protein